MSLNSKYLKSTDESNSDEYHLSSILQTRSAANDSQTYESAMVLSVNLWSEQKDKEQLSFIMLRKIQKTSEWSLRHKLEQE